MKPPLVSIIIPHYNGYSILKNCLDSVRRTEYPNFEIIVVDNASTDGSPEQIKAHFPEIKLIRNERNLGFAGGVNVGISNSSADFVLLLNNDTEVESKWMGRMIRLFYGDEDIAACQPKILSIQQRNMFDYSGAAGGLIDVYGFPFARGRIFDSIEEDGGQYDTPERIFWATGTACLIRKSCLDHVGGLDEHFFAHMEEIDLDWRLQLAGYKIIFSPDSIVYHLSGATLSSRHYLKKFLNHRNSVLILLKNFSAETLFLVLPIRFLLEILAFFFSIISGDFKRAVAIVNSILWILFHPALILRKRARSQKLRRVPDRIIMGNMLKKSVALQYFVLRKKSWKEISGLKNSSS
ncbi:MAG: glycosyltransferase family 2 protein [Fidelibacterota bacterium]